jgi:hypothetical protein
VTTTAGPGAIDADHPSAATWRAGTAAALGPASGRFVLIALAAVLALSLVADLAGSKPSAADTDIRVTADGDTSVVLCVIDAAGQARCFGRGSTVAGALDGRDGPAICGVADRPLVSPCPGVPECTFPRAAMTPDAFGLVVLEPRPPLFGVPRHRLVDVVVMAPDPAAVPPQLAAGVRTLARCFAPLGPAAEAPATTLSRQACENGPCRLHHSSVRIAGIAR